MNTLERTMVNTLMDLKKNHHVSGIKAEFEAEGTRMEEMLRLKEIVTKAGLELTIKIGGCEAIRDMYECRVIGVDRIVAPMIESAYALKKYLAAARMAFPADEIDQVDFLINVETFAGVKALDEMLALPEIKELDGIVLGRVDMTGSLGLTREDINSPRILKIAKDMFAKAKKHGLECVVGGGVSAHSLPFFHEIPEGHLDRYETRKVIFQCPDALGASADRGILKAVGFELMWLKNKRDYYSIIATEDNQRISMLEARYKKLIEDAGGKVE